ncbi:tetratricopeptide repeat protein [Candidatus Obscuribacterales bacterium]|nr:tetratricopeptide repeat protein [Candidatus Obscuribacterales bacterium]
MITSKVQTILDVLGTKTYSPEWFKLVKLIGTEPKDTTCGIALVEHSFEKNGFSISENDGTYTEVNFFYERQNFESFEEEVLKDVELGISRDDVHQEIGKPVSTRERGKHKPAPETDSKDELRKWELQKVEPIEIFDTYTINDYFFTLEFDAEDDYLSRVTVIRLTDVPKERLMEAGLYEDAIRHWQNVASEEKNDLEYIAHLNLAHCYEKLGDAETAEIEYKLALETSKCMIGDDTPFGITRIEYARFLMKLRRSSDALIQFKKHLEEHSDKVDADLANSFRDYAQSLGVSEQEFQDLLEKRWL